MWYPVNGMGGAARLRLAAAAAGMLALAWVLRPEARPRPALHLGDPAPALELEDAAGQPAALTHYGGKVVLIDFWATWCDTCEAELPELKRLHSLYRGRGFEILAPSVDAEGLGAVVPYAGRHGIPWRILLADAASADRFGVRGLPTKVLVDRDGRVAAKYAGPAEPAGLEREIVRLLERKRRT